MIHRLSTALMVALGLILGGCISSPPARFYLLTPMPGPGAEVQSEADDDCMFIGVGPVEIPAYLDRPQIVTRFSTNELNLAEFHKWAEPLKDALVRVLEENLSNLLCTGIVPLFQWGDPIAVDYQIVMEVIRFDGDMGGHALLWAQWSILEGESRKRVVTKKSVISVKVAGQEFAHLVLAQSQALENLSRQIAAELKKLTP